MSTFKEKNYQVVKNAISMDIVWLATQYAIFDEFRNQDISSSLNVNAHSKYADPLMESILLRIMPIVEEVTEKELVPTYSYHRVYRNNSELLPHKDRPSCEYSATLSFLYSYNSNTFNWPIFMDGTPVNLYPGDMAVYKGMEVEHWREKLLHNDPVWHVQAFFHYVEKNGPCAEWIFDKRDSLGQATRENPKQESIQEMYIYQPEGFLHENT